MSSTTGKVENNTGLTLTFSSGGVSHGNNPDFYQTSLAAGDTAAIFIAHSDGAGVEGTVNASGPAGSGVSFQLLYDNPVVGGNSGSVQNATSGYKGSCSVGGGDNNTNTYTLSVA